MASTPNQNAPGEVDSEPSKKQTRQEFSSFAGERLNIGRTWPLLFFIVAALLFCRQPSALIHPVLYAEDGGIFFKQQYETGFGAALLTHYAGYLHLAPRIVAGMCSWLPLEYIPFAYATVSLFIAAGTLTFFFAPGFRPVVNSDRVRAGIVILFALMPNAEPLMKVAYLNWYMLFFTALLTLFSLPQGMTARWLLLVPAAIAGWSNPVTVICLPVVLYRAWKANDLPERAWWIALLLLDAGFLLTLQKDTSHPEMLLHQRSWKVALLHAIGYRVFCFFFLGKTMCYPRLNLGWKLFTGISLVLAALCGGAVGWATVKSKKNGIARSLPLMIFYLVLALPVLFILRREWQPLFLTWSRDCWQLSDRYFFCSTLLLCVLGGLFYERVLRAWMGKTRRRREILLVALVCWLLLQGMGFELDSWQTEKGWPPYAQNIRDAEGRARQTGNEEKVHIKTSPLDFDFDVVVSKTSAERNR